MYAMCMETRAIDCRLRDGRKIEHVDRTLNERKRNRKGSSKVNLLIRLNRHDRATRTER